MDQVEHTGWITRLDHHVGRGQVGFTGWSAKVGRETRGGQVRHTGWIPNVGSPGWITKLDVQVETISLCVQSGESNLVYPTCVCVTSPQRLYHPTLTLRHVKELKGLLLKEVVSFTDQ